MEITISEEVTEVNKITCDNYNVKRINSIKKKYKNIRDASKEPTFLLTYMGTWSGLMNNCGFSEEESKAIELNFHALYSESKEWLEAKINECCEKGYATVAFGLRVRTPLLAKSILGTSATARESEAEARSVGNAISGQSYGLLNSRAAIAFMNKVYASDYKYDINPVGLIHDAAYFIIKDDVRVVKWVNDNLIEEMAWQELEELKHPTVKLEAELDLFVDWNQPITLPNHSSIQEIKTIVSNHLNKE